MARLAKSHPAKRDALVARMRDHLERTHHPRLAMSFIIAVAGASAFLFSAISLQAGLTSMMVRYVFAAVISYIAFVALIRVWIAFHRRGRKIEDWVDVDIPTDFSGSGRSGSDEVNLFTGGRSGGGGATMNFQSARVSGQSAVSVEAPQPAVKSGGGGKWSFDSDDAWPVIAVVLAIAALVAIISVVAAAPLLLAEVALDAGIASAIYKRLERHDVGNWMHAVFRRTWLPALVVIVLAGGIGYALERAAPGAASIGAVVRALTS